MAREGEVIHVPEVGGGKFGQYTEGGTTRVDFKGEPTKSGYLTFYLGGMSTINWSILYQDPESKNNPIGEINKSTKTIL